MPMTIATSFVYFPSPKDDLFQILSRCLISVESDVIIVNFMPIISTTKSYFFNRLSSIWIHNL